jgi:hypothetical protein
MSLEAANREVYLLLKEGIKVSVPESDSTPHPGPLPGRGGAGVKSGGQKTERLRVVDWEHPANNDFLLVNKGSALNLYSSPYSPVHGHFSSEAQTTSASFRANTCRFAKAGGA